MKTRRRSIINAVLLTVASLFIGACRTFGTDTETGADVRVLDLKLMVGPIGWKDNETIVVVGDSGERYSRKDGGIQSVARVMSVNYTTGQRTTYGKVSSGPCFADGYISYVFWDRAKDELWASYGELGNEVSQLIKRGDPGFDTGAGGSCRPWKERPPRPAFMKEEIQIRYLWPRVGFINCNVRSASVSNQYVKARFHKTDDPVGIEVPFSCYEVSMGLRYYAFKNAYFAWEHDFRHPWPEGRDRRAFWLYPDGRVETMTFKYSPAVTHEAIPTKRGLVAFARALTREDDYWVYLLTPDLAKKIVRGDADGVTSPDGCKVAMSHDPDFKAHIRGRAGATTATLKVLELCR